MSYVVINALTVPEGGGPEIEKRFEARKHSVDNAPGFEGFQLLRPVKGEERYFVLTQWKDEESYVHWRDGESKYLHAHGNPTDDKEDRKGEPVATNSQLLEFDVVLDSQVADD